MSCFILSSALFGAGGPSLEEMGVWCRVLGWLPLWAGLVSETSLEVLFDPARVKGARPVERHSKVCRNLLLQIYFCQRKFPKGTVLKPSFCGFRAGDWVGHPQHCQVCRLFGCRNGPDGSLGQRYSAIGLSGSGGVALPLLPSPS